MAVSALACQHSSRMTCVVVATLLVAALSYTHAAAPIAHHLVYTVPKNGEVVIRLAGYDSDGDKLTARITSAPDSGSNWQLSQVFSDYGYEPKRGSQVSSVAGAGEVVTGSKNRIVYTPPSNTNPPNGKWSSFTYTVSDATATSEPGIVWLVPEHSRMVSSDFSNGVDGWSVIANGARAAAMANGGLTWEPFSRGLLNHYIMATDAEIHTNSKTQYDDSRWYFKAPAKFHGNHAMAYGGQLEFSWASAAGDFAANNINGKAAVVVLDCATCARGSGIRLAVFADSKLGLDGATSTVSVSLVESRWLKDPKNTLHAWSNPTQCEMVEVLSGITGFKILGDHTRWYETLALDTVSYKHGNSVPVECADIYY